MPDPTPPLIFSTAASAPLADAVAARLGAERALVETRTFPDGERGHRLASPVDGRAAVLLGATASDADTLELYDLACGLVGYGARRLALVIPYFGCSTMERAVRPGEVVSAKTRARLLSSIPAAGEGNRVFLLDLHVDGIAHYFEGAVRPVHVYAKPIVMAAVTRLGAGDPFVLACTDAGRAKWVQSLSRDLGVPAAFIFKHRASATATEITAVSAQVEGRAVVIYDDMIRTGGSLLGAARAYRDAGARRVAAVATHGIFPGDALDRIRSSGLLDCIVTTDSHPRARLLAAAHPDFLHIDSVADLLGDALRGNPWSW